MMRTQPLQPLLVVLHPVCVRAGFIPRAWLRREDVEAHFLGSPSLPQRLDHRNSSSPVNRGLEGL